MFNAYTSHLKCFVRFFDVCQSHISLWVSFSSEFTHHAFNNWLLSENMNWKSTADKYIYIYIYICAFNVLHFIYVTYVLNIYIYMYMLYIYIYIYTYMLNIRGEFPAPKRWNGETFRHKNHRWLPMLFIGKDSIAPLKHRHVSYKVGPPLTLCLLGLNPSN